MAQTHWHMLMNIHPKHSLMRGSGAVDPMSRLPLALMVTGLLILIIGGSIRINDAGESCPEWPTCFGKIHPFVSAEEQLEWWNDNPEEADSRHDYDPDHTYTAFQIFIEWLHRLLAGLVAIPVLLNWLHVRKRKNELGEDMVGLAFAGGILLILQAIAGYITVKFDNADWSVALHLTLAVCWISIFIWQWLLWQARTRGLNRVNDITPEHALSVTPRLRLLTGAVLFLLVLGAWVASTAGGEYNKGCSTGFTSGWPLCQGEWLPSMEQMGELVQMVHRLGALVVGGALMWGSVRMRELVRETGRGEVLTRFVEASTGMWFLNVLIGGVYIITAGAEGFIELLSLLHLIFGVASFLAIMTALLICRVAIMEPFLVEEE